MPKLSKRQKFNSFVCHLLAGDEHEERATNLLPKKDRIKGLRLKTYNFFSWLRGKEADRLVKKYNTHIFTD